MSEPHPTAAEAVAFVRSRCAIVPRIALVLGSGLGGFADSVDGTVRFAFADLKGFPVSSVTSHKGELILGYVAGVPVAVLSGRVHYYEQGDAKAMRTPIETLKLLGAEALILTNAAGGLDPETGPGELMLISDHINFSGTNPLIGETGDERFVGLTQAYDPAISGLFREAADAEGIRLSSGVYMWFNGPSFETPAEIRFARLIGASAVGMSTVPEVILARFFGLRVAAVSTITNFAAGMTGNEISHLETKENGPKGAEKLKRLLPRVIAAFGGTAA